MVISKIHGRQKYIKTHLQLYLPVWNWLTKTETYEWIGKTTKTDLNSFLTNNPLSNG